MTLHIIACLCGYVYTMLYVYIHIYTHRYTHAYVLLFRNSFSHCRQARREQNFPSLAISTSALQAAIRQKQDGYINHCKSAHFSTAQSPKHRATLEYAAP